ERRRLGGRREGAEPEGGAAGGDVPRRVAVAGREGPAPDHGSVRRRANEGPDGCAAAGDPLQAAVAGDGPQGASRAAATRRRGDAAGEGVHVLIKARSASDG